MTLAPRSVRTFLLPLLLATPAAAQGTTRVSLANGGAETNNLSESGSCSADGRYVAFDSLATNLVANDPNGVEDVFVLDRRNNVVSLISRNSFGTPGNGASAGPMITPDGRYVAFVSVATNLASGDINGALDVFVRDLRNGTTTRASLALSGDVFGASFLDSMTPDARFVVFESDANNVTGVFDNNSGRDVFVRDRQNASTDCVSLTPAFATGALPSQHGSISADGRFVAFDSFASNLVAGDTNGMLDVFVRDRLSGSTELVSLSSAGSLGNQQSSTPAISADGRFVVFVSSATNLVAGGTNGLPQLFVRDRQAGTTSLLATALGGAQPDGSSDRPRISADGRFVAFQSAATNLVAGDANGQADVFLCDRAFGSMELVDISTAGAQANGLASLSALSPNGRFVVFSSLATNLVPGDTNGASDVFLRDRGPQAPGTDLCQPGAGGVLACPCGNPPANSPRGCDNSAASGGAQLLASGVASLASDTLVFDTLGETTGAASILLQGSAELPAGAVFGQGVRCAGGTLLRLYVASAAGGTIHVPGAGAASVSARAAALGGPLAPLALRWYQVYYRDNAVLGGCPSTSNFNTTQALRVPWLP